MSIPPGTPSEGEGEGALLIITSMKNAIEDNTIRRRKRILQQLFLRFIFLFYYVVFAEEA
jgi:hypothetical protein